MAPHALLFRPAIVADVAAVVRLVNSAYRGDSSRRGWTTEADLIGGQRTDLEGVRELVDAGALLLAFVGDRLVGSMQLERREAGAAYLGMFTIDPELQGSGLGKAFLVEAERRAREWGARRVEMTVITRRVELLAFYERRGYVRTGRRVPFPAHDPRNGFPLVELELEVLEKDLG